ncbi:MAG: dephospho-CoA kinase [Phycisphaerae bacterium]|nr:dephospho-CoA kinase [Phycisphaerae bacterium]
MNAPQRPTIGLVGGIGSGKSTVAANFRDAGCVVCNSDELARAALDDPAIRATLAAWWGPSIVDPAGVREGKVDRSAVAKIVFTNLDERQRLEHLVHPWIERARRAQFDAAPASTVALVIDAPLLLEVGLDSECDAVVFVDAPAVERLRRVTENRNWHAEELARREAAQWPLDRKRASADYVIRNEGTLSSLHAEADRVLKAILAEFRRKNA